MHFDLAQGLMLLVPLVLSLTVHEWAHAWSAHRLGDDTAKAQGRLTLNPIPHIDPIGTLILPLLGIPFGWAKPVPINPTRFRPGVDMKKGMMVTAAAGPLSNVLLALVCAVAFGLVARFSPQLLNGPYGIASLLKVMIQINVTLAIFNLIPVPPLDGSRVVEGLVPYGWRAQWESIVRLSPLLLIALVFFSGRIIAGPAGYVMGWLDRVIVAMQ